MNAKWLLIGVCLMALWECPKAHSISWGFKSKYAATLYENKIELNVFNQTVVILEYPRAQQQVTDNSSDAYTITAVYATDDSNTAVECGATPFDAEILPDGGIGSTQITIRFHLVPPYLCNVVHLALSIHGVEL